MIEQEFNIYFDGSIAVGGLKVLSEGHERSLFALSFEGISKIKKPGESVSDLEIVGPKVNMIFSDLDSLEVVLKQIMMLREKMLFGG